MSEYSAIQVSERVYWVGAIDWELRNFHGYNTSRGTTYNAFLVLGDQPILIDTVKESFYPEMMARISSIIDPEKIQYLISNHAEMDHSGCLPRVVEAIKPEKIFASKMGVKALQEHFHMDYELTELSSGQQLTLGNADFIFVETRMLHWPDSMFSYLVNDGILFSQDGFGMHFATPKLFADQNDPAILRYEAAKYFANILLPYSSFVSRLLEQLPGLKLDIKMIAPDHGPLWRTSSDIAWILELWTTWARQTNYQKAVIVYDTMWNSTAKMARVIADGIQAEGVAVEVLPMSGVHRSDVAAQLLEAGALLLGSPTLNQQLFPTMAEILCYLKGLKRRNLIGQAFGSYGWGGEAVKSIGEELQQMEVELVAEPIKIKYVPTAADLLQCRKLGQNIAQHLIARGKTDE